MVDNRGISPIANTGFKQDNASANKMSEEKYGQGGEYFAQEMQEEESSEFSKETTFFSSLVAKVSLYSVLELFDIWLFLPSLKNKMPTVKMAVPAILNNTARTTCPDVYNFIHLIY